LPTAVNGTIMIVAIASRSGRGLALGLAVAMGLFPVGFGRVIVTTLIFAVAAPIVYAAVFIVVGRCSGWPPLNWKTGFAPR
jgi:hypothetical protein